MRTLLPLAGLLLLALFLVQLIQFASALPLLAQSAGYASPQLLPALLFKLLLLLAVNLRLLWSTLRALRRR